MAVNTTVEVVMPAMGDSVSEGTVLEWHKQEGDAVAEDETLVEISTDKVDAEVPAPVAGTVVKIHAAEGDTVAVGACSPRSRPTNGAGPRAAASRADAEAPPRRRAGEATVDRDRDAGDGRVGLRGHDPRVGQAARRRGRRGRDDRRDLHRQGRRRGARARVRHARPRSSPRPATRSPSARCIARMTAGDGAAPAAAAPTPEPTAAPRPAGDAETDRARPTASRSRPVAARVAAAHGVDLANGRTAPARPAASRKADVLGRRERRRRRAAAAAAAAGRRATLLKGARGDARALHGRVALDPDRDLVPHAHRHRRSTRAASSSRRPASKVSFTHLIAYAIARAATEQMPVMAHHFAEIDGKPHVIDDGAGQPRHRRRRREEGRRAHADGARSSATPAGSRFPQFLDAFNDADRQGARRTSSPPTTSRAPTSRSPTRAASARSPPSRG